MFTFTAHLAGQWVRVRAGYGKPAQTVCECGARQLVAVLTGSGRRLRCHECGLMPPLAETDPDMNPDNPPTFAIKRHRATFSPFEVTGERTLASRYDTHEKALAGLARLVDYWSVQQGWSLTHDGRTESLGAATLCLDNDITRFEVVLL